MEAFFGQTALRRRGSGLTGHGPSQPVFDHVMGVVRIPKTPNEPRDRQAVVDIKASPKFARAVK